MRLAILSGALAALVVASSAHAGVVENFNIEDWGGLAYADDTTGKIANCSVYAANQKGATLLFIKNADGSWFFSLTDDDWKLTANSEYPVRYKIDGRRTVDAQALALSDTQLGIYMASDDPFFGQVKRGNRLVFTYEGETYPFDLSDSGLALDAAEACLERHKRKDAQVAEATPEPESAAEPETREEVAQATTDNDVTVQVPPASPEAAEQNEASEAQNQADVAPAALPPLGDQEIESIEVPGWEAAAYGEVGGAFTHCAIRAEYENGTTFGLARSADRTWVLGLAREDWSSAAGRRVPIRYTYQTGGAPADVEAEALAVTPNLLAVTLGQADGLQADLTATPELAVEAEGKRLTFDITDIGPGLEAIEACLQKHGEAARLASSSKKKSSSSKKSAKVATESQAAGDDESAAQAEASTETPAEPVEAEQTADAGEPQGENAAEQPVDAGNSEAAGASSNTGGVSAELKAEAKDFTASLLSRSGYSDHSMLSGDDVPASMRSRAAAWQIGEIMGVTDIVGGTLAEVRQQLESTDRADCGGEFTHELASERDGSAHVFSRCKAPNLNLHIQYVILPREAEGFYLLSLIAFAEGSAVDSIAAKVFETARAS